MNIYRVLCEAFNAETYVDDTYDIATAGMFH